MASLSAEQLDDLQGFLKDWLRHCGRSQADLRRALRAPSIRMPVLIEELHLIHARQGLLGLVEKLCGIEQQWRAEPPRPLQAGGEHPLEGPDATESDGFEDRDLEDSFGQLDLLLEQIRQGS
jgi:hypothetical protein